MQFKYLYEVQATGFIDIENIGEICLSAINTIFHQEYILIIHTELGKSKILQYGPIFIDEDIPLSNVSAYYSEIDYSSSKLEKIIDKFINNPKYLVSQVTEIDLETAKSKIKNLGDFIWFREIRLRIGVEKS